MATSGAVWVAAGVDNQGMLHCLSGQRHLQRRGQFDPLQPFLHEHLQCSHSCMNTSSSAAKASASRTSTVPTNRRTSSGVTRGKRPAMSLMAFGKKTLLQRAVSLFSFVSCVNDAPDQRRLNQPPGNGQRKCHGQWFKNDRRSLMAVIFPVTTLQRLRSAAGGGRTHGLR